MNLSDFGVEGERRKTLVVLGAGASRGSSFVVDETQPLPPLDLDFFQQLARMPSSDNARQLLEFVRREYHHEVGLSMEQFFSDADYTDQFHQELNVDRGPLVRKYAKALGNFLTVLPDMLNLTTSEPCAYHELLAAMLHAQDCVLSFNYDCVIDRALRDKAGRRWNPDLSGYGFAVVAGGDAWKKHGSGHPFKTSIRLLKMHGSLNWNRATNGDVSLLADTKASTSLKNSIIPPTWFKDLAKPPFKDVWKTARKEIRTARVLVVIGYSVPATDLFSRSLFKVEAGSKEKREKLDLLVLVNPDAEARLRFLEIIRGGLEASTRILEYRTLDELATVLERNKRQSVVVQPHSSTISIRGQSPTITVGPAGLVRSSVPA